jgi:hypothetical protein
MPPQQILVGVPLLLFMRQRIQEVVPKVLEETAMELTNRTRPPWTFARAIDPHPQYPGLRLEFFRSSLQVLLCRYNARQQPQDGRNHPHRNSILPL